MNILIFEQRYTSLREPGIRRFDLFSRIWAKEGHSITIIAGMVNYVVGKKSDAYKGKFFAQEREGKNIEIIRVFDSGLGYRTFFGRLLSYGTFFLSAFIAGLLIRPRPNVIIASSPPIFAGVLGFLVGFLRRAKFIFEVRDLWPDEAVELGFLKNKALIRLSHWLEGFLYRKSRAMIVNSPGLKEFLISAKKVSPEKITIIRNPMSFKENNDFSARETLGWTKKFVVLYTGSMSAVYDFDIVIDAAEKLKGEESILFVFVGDGRGKAPAMKRATGKGLKNVVFMPPVPKSQIMDFTVAADLGIAALKSSVDLLQYVYATKIFDYMAASRPILLAMRGVGPDLVCKDAKCGVCVLPGDTEEFTNAIYEMYKDSFSREKMGARGFEYLKKNFNPEELAKKYLEVIVFLSR